MKFLLAIFFLLVLNTAAHARVIHCVSKHDEIIITEKFEFFNEFGHPHPDYAYFSDSRLERVLENLKLYGKYEPGHPRYRNTGSNSYTLEILNYYSSGSPVRVKPRSANGISKYKCEIKEKLPKFRVPVHLKRIGKSSTEENSVAFKCNFPDLAKHGLPTKVSWDTSLGKVFFGSKSYEIYHFSQYKSKFYGNIVDTVSFKQAGEHIVYSVKSKTYRGYPPEFRFDHYYSGGGRGTVSGSCTKVERLAHKASNSTKRSDTFRCDLTVPQIKEAQKYLKELELYPYKIDGIAGKGTLAGIKKAKEMLGAKASAGECITSADIKAFDQLAAATRCSPEKLGQCSDAMVCDRATVLREGVRSWNFDEIAYVNRAKDLSLDCKITIDNTPFSQEEAVYYLSQLVDFVTENAADFDLKFASEFDKVRPITKGEWSKGLSENFELFRVYIAKFPSFQKHLEELRLADDTANQKRVEQLRGSLTQDMTVLREWAKANVLDAKAAEIAALDATLGNKSSQDVNALEQLVAETQRLLMATGIKDGPVQQVTQEVVDSLYDPSSVYLFVNTSGDAANVYKNLDGIFTFEQNSGTYCPTEKLGAFDYYLLRERLFEAFEGLSSVEQDCSRATDIFVVKGNELTTDRVFDIIPLSGLSQVSEFSKADRDKAYDQLTFLKETIQKDVLDGTRVGFGILKTDQTASKVCAIIDGDEYGHQKQISQHRLLMSALNLQWDGFEKVTSSSEEAFKFLQRGQCDAIYAGSLNLGRLYLAGDIANVSLEFLPIWISKASVEASQQAYDDSVAASAQANAEAEQNLEDQAKLNEQAKQSAAELAAVRQRELREQNGLRFMVLRDELQDQVFAASEFGFENPSEEAGYIKRYLVQPFVDQTTRYSPFDGIIGDMQTLAAERWEITEQRLDQMDYGDASFNGRSVDALQVELKIASKNRLVGKYSEYCRRIHAIKDEDFEMWRNISVMDCSNETATSQWKLQNSFKSKWIIQPE